MVRLNWALILALLALVSEIPMIIGAVMKAKTGQSPDGFIFDMMPGMGMAPVLMLGGAYVAHAAVKQRGPVRWVLGSAWLAQFAGVTLVVPIYLLASSQGMTYVELWGWLFGGAGYAGWAALATNGVLIFAAEIVVPALVISASQISDATAKKAERVEEIKRASGGTEADVLLVLDGASVPMTTQEVASHIGKTKQTVMNVCKRLERSGRVVKHDDQTPHRWSIERTRA